MFFGQLEYITVYPSMVLTTQSEVQGAARLLDFVTPPRWYEVLVEDDDLVPVSEPKSFDSVMTYRASVGSTSAMVVFGLRALAPRKRASPAHCHGP